MDDRERLIRIDENVSHIRDKITGIEKSARELTSIVQKHSIDIALMKRKSPLTKWIIGLGTVIATYFGLKR